MKHENVPTTHDCGGSLHHADPAHLHAPFMSALTPTPEHICSLKCQHSSHSRLSFDTASSSRRPAHPTSRAPSFTLLPFVQDRLTNIWAHTLQTFVKQVFSIHR
ncbi:uncharacterized protein UMAG_02927 [Mycosarcoma maydis]|uniref:Uncharacterized protein n=1 Tax=Mycosarcoma maydis TaxID=5270 RepID=A0A0D1C5K7_MYCMD|nr:uncharacterized protein UMAG_02927 [Ustilago maydis 521]KIS68942.1 hypothetical protein UMAG_02927 [Ustilago maydis 521]|eukprot:XP_011389343.1 hypothetical protein UMAG_02927 [Ustilago maydis 521]